MIGYLKKENLIEPGSDKVIVSGKIERKIFENIVMEPQEKEQLKNLKQALVNFAPLRLPKEWQDSDYLRMLAYCDYEIGNTIQVLKQHLCWRNNINLSHPPNAVVLNGAVYGKIKIFLHCIGRITFQFNITLTSNLLSIHTDKQEYFIIHGHDKGFRPVIIINIFKALKVKQIQISIQTRRFQDRDVLISYYVESTIILIDMGNLIQISHLLTNEFMDFVKNCEQNYYGRIHKIYIFEDIYNCLFNRLVQILKPESQDKIVFLQKKDLSQLTNQIEQNQLEAKFLGFQSDIFTDFWPPKDLSPEKTEKKDRKDEVKTIISNTDENVSKSQLIVQKNRHESSLSSQLFLQVYNEEQEININQNDLLIQIKNNRYWTVSESHLIEFADSINDLIEYSPDSQFQISHHNYYKGNDSAPLQSTTIKPRDLQMLESENWSSSEQQMSSNLAIQPQRRNPCCQSSSICQLI